MNKCKDTFCNKHYVHLAFVDWFAGLQVDPSYHLSSLSAFLTWTAWSTRLCWHPWFRYVHPMQSGWKLSLAFSWSWIGDGGDGALLHWQAGPEPFFTTQSYQRDYWKKGYVELMLLGNHYSKIDTIRHKSINNCNAPETVDCWFLFLAKPIPLLSVAFKKNTTLVGWQPSKHSIVTEGCLWSAQVLHFCTLHILHLCCYKKRRTLRC